jgi:serine/threonine-protein kinase
MKTGDVLAGRYKLLERIGAGGMGEVWRGEQAPLGRPVAIKLIPREQDQPSLRERFAREAELAAKVDHRNVVDIIEYGVSDEGDPYLVMPMLKGESLAARLARAPSPSLGELLAWARAILSGLAAIHDEGIVHRDLKPGNVFLAQDADGVVPKLLDFGISRSRAGGGSGSLTQLGTAMGTPEYMAPEQFESARDVDHRADLYGAGAILYEALAGRPPFQAPDAFAIYRAILQGDPPSLGALRPDLPEPLVALVHRALAKDPGDRFPDARAMRDAIDALAKGGVLDAAATATLDRELRARTEAAEMGVAPTLAIDAVALTTPKTVAMASGTPKTVAMASGTPKTVAMASGTPKTVAMASDTLSDPGTKSASATPKTVAIVGAERTEPQTSPPAHVSARPAVEPEKKSSWVLLAVIVVALVGGGAAYGLGLFDRDEGGTTPVTRPVGTEPTASTDVEAAAQGQRVAGPERLSVLALAWARLSPPDRQLDVRLVASAGRWVMVAAPTVREIDAARLAAALGGGLPVAAPWDASAGLRPALRAPNVRLNVHVEPAVASPTTRVIPHDTAVVALYGTIDGQASVEEGDGALTYFVVAPSDSGWALSRYLRPFDGCVPDLTAFGAEMGDAETALNDALVAPTFVLTTGVRTDAFLVTTRDRRAARSTVAVYRAGEECTLGERLHLQTFEGILDEVFFTETAPVNGQSLLLASWSPGATPPTDGVLEWGAYVLGTDTPVWTDRLASSPQLPRRRRAAVSGVRDRVLRTQSGEHALAVRRPGEENVLYRWDVATSVLTDGRTPSTEVPSAPPTQPAPGDTPPNPFGEGDAPAEGPATP